MKESEEHTIFGFIYCSKEKEVKINTKEYLGGKYHQPSVSYLHEEDILWILNTIRSIPKPLFERGGVDKEKEHTDDDFVNVRMFSGNERNYLGRIKISIYNKKSGPGFSIAFDSFDPMNPEDSLYKFLDGLEKYVPEEDKDKIIPAWR